MKKTPLESWLFRKIDIDYEATPERAKKYIETYQLEKIRETIKLAQQNSLFYKKNLSTVSIESLDSFEDFQKIPFTTAEDIQENPLYFLCVSQDEIQRIVTLNTSGTSGESKRIYFTKKDQELIVDFFTVGMSTLVKGGDRVLVLLPGQQPGSVGDLLKKALEGINIKVYSYGFVDDVEKVLNLIEKERINCLVGLPVQVLKLARSQKSKGPSSIQKCLLTADYVPEVAKKVLQENWGCKVFTHYGMTEMGLGGGVDCEALKGYHLREVDLYFEVIDPHTGKPVLDGEWGEVVFTTLTRGGMPLIRYRTGDISRFIPEPCPCGSILKRLDKVMGRWDALVKIQDGEFLSIGQLDEVVFGFSEVLDYDVLFDDEDLIDLHIHIKVQTENFPILKKEIQETLEKIPVIHKGIMCNKMKSPSISRWDEDIRDARTKRRIKHYKKGGLVV